MEKTKDLFLVWWFGSTCVTAGLVSIIIEVVGLHKAFPDSLANSIPWAEAGAISFIFGCGLVALALLIPFIKDVDENNKRTGE